MDTSDTPNEVEMLVYIALCRAALPTFSKLCPGAETSQERFNVCFDAMVKHAPALIAKARSEAGAISDATTIKEVDVIFERMAEELGRFGAERFKLLSDNPTKRTVEIPVSMTFETRNAVMDRANAAMQLISEDLGLSAYETLGGMMFSMGRFACSMGMLEENLTDPFMSGYKYQQKADEEAKKRG